MRTLLIAATPAEIQPTLDRLLATATSSRESILTLPDGSEVEVLLTGVGLLATAFALGDHFANPGRRPQLAIQAGIGGAVDRQLALGQVVRIVTERVTDLGAETAEEELIPHHRLGLGLPPGFTPDGIIELPPAPPAGLTELPACHGGSVNRVHGSAASVARLRTGFPEVQVESMEGAAFAYACGRAGVDGLQLRAISNYVEPRDRAGWRIGEAVAALNRVLADYFFDSRNSR